MEQGSDNQPQAAPDGAAEAIPFNRPHLTGNETAFIQRAIANGKIGPGGEFGRHCQEWLSRRFEVPLALPTGSCTAALEIAVLLLDIGPGDEVIMPSFGYPSTANAVARTGANIVFVDIEPDTMNIDPTAIENAITDKTRAIIVIHYAGIACDMDRIGSIAAAKNVAVIEDAAGAFLSRYRDAYCGTVGTFGCFSFHETKNIQCGQGGALLINKAEFASRAEILLEKGTDRRAFGRGEIDKYTWRDLGSSYAMEELRAAVLAAQLDHCDETTDERVKIWSEYRDQLGHLVSERKIECLVPPGFAQGNGHIFWLKAADRTERDSLIRHLAERRIQATFHYVPLHSSEAGRRFGRFYGKDIATTRDAGRIIRLPIYSGLKETGFVVNSIIDFFTKT